MVYLSLFDYFTKFYQLLPLYSQMKYDNQRCIERGSGRGLFWRNIMAYISMDWGRNTKINTGGRLDDAFYRYMNQRNQEHKNSLTVRQDTVTFSVSFTPVLIFTYAETCESVGHTLRIISKGHRHEPVHKFRNV